MKRSNTYVQRTPQTLTCQLLQLISFMKTNSNRTNRNKHIFKINKKNIHNI